MSDQLKLVIAHAPSIDAVIDAGPANAACVRSEQRPHAPSLWQIWWLVPLAMIPLLLLLEHYLDTNFSALFYDAAHSGFYLRRHWLTQDVIHQFGLYPIGALVLSTVWLLSRPSLCARLRFDASLIRLALISILANAAVVNALKRSANTACSWDLHTFGGAYPNSGWFTPLASGLAPGHCWPGAFSLGGFAVIGLYFVLHELGKPRLAGLALLLSLGYGSFLGITQVVRGAHALSHQFWTALICWYVSLLLYRGWYYVHRKPINQRGSASLYD